MWVLTRLWTSLVAGATLCRRSRWARLCKHVCHLTLRDSLLLSFAFNMYNTLPLTFSGVQYVQINCTGHVMTKKTLTDITSKHCAPVLLINPHSVPVVYAHTNCSSVVSCWVDPFAPRCRSVHGVFASAYWEDDWCDREKSIGSVTTGPVMRAPLQRSRTNIGEQLRREQVGAPNLHEARGASTQCCGTCTIHTYILAHTLSHTHG